MKKKIREIILNIKYIFNFTYKHQREYYFFWGIGIIFSIINTWVSIFYFKYMIDLLLDKKIELAVHVTFVFAAVIFLIEIFSSIAALFKSRNEKKIIDQLESLLALKQMEMRYDEIIALKTREQYFFSKKVVLEGGIGSVMDNISNVVSSFITYMGVSFIFSHLSMGVLITIVLVIIINTIGNIKKMNYVHERYAEETPIERNLYYARDYLTSPVFAKEVRVFNLKDFTSSKIKNYIEKYFNLEILIENKYFQNYWWTYIANGAQLISIYIYLGYLLYNNTLSVSQFSMYVSAAFVFSATIQGSIQSVTNLIQNSKYIKEFRTFLNKTEEVSEDKILLPHGNTFTFTFENVSYQYENESTWAVKDLNIEIHTNERICIVGENGAGKTTLINLLMGFHRPTSGKILLNGIDINQFEHQEYLSLFSTVFQDFNILNFSIGENIAMKESYNATKVSAAATKAGIFEKITSLDESFETYISQSMSEKGTDLSGGERQMLAIARAVYKDAPIFILDEPTSALSPQKEYEIYNKFEELTKNKTVIYISHRLSSCKFADRIFVLKSGEIIESGNHEELLRNKNLYEKMFKAQAQYYEVNDNVDLSAI